MSASEIAAWVAVVGAVFSLIVQAYRILRDRNKEKKEVEVALDRNPIIKKQLELGNIGAAVENLNAIIQSQARHIDRQEAEIRVLERENEELRLKIRACEQDAARLLEQVEDLTGLVDRLRNGAEK